MATMKSLNTTIASEAIKANRESKNAVNAEGDGQAFAQTLRQQIQQDSATQSNRGNEARLTEARLNEHKLTDTRNRLANQERQNQQIRLSEQANHAASSIGKSKQAIAENKQVNQEKTSNTIDEALAEKLASQTTELSETNMLDGGVSSLDLKQSLTNHKALGDENVLEKMPNKNIDKKVDEKILDTTEADENTIANMGWLASMMAMRENQATQAPKVTMNAETGASDALSPQAGSEVLNSDSTLALLGDGMLNQQNGVSQTAVNQHTQSDVQQGVADALNVLGSQTAASDKTSSSRESFSDVLAKQSNASNASPLDADLLKQVSEQAFSQKQALSQENMTDMASMINANPAVTAPTTLSPMTESMVAQINVPFGLKGWQDAMNNQVMQMTQQGSEVATLTLSPPDLGPVQVVLRVDNQSVDTAFISDNANVRQALEDGLQDLKERMASQGLQLGNTFVGNGNQAQQHFGTSPQQTTTFSNPLPATNNEVIGVVPVRALPLGLVDTFV